MSNYNDKLKCDVCGKSPAMPVHVTSVVAGKKHSQSGTLCDEHMSRSNELSRVVQEHAKKRNLKRILVPIILIVFVVVLVGIWNFVAGVRNVIRPALTEENARLICFDFQNIIIELSPEVPTQDILQDAFQNVPRKDLLANRWMNGGR